MNVQIGQGIDWNWGRGPILNQQFPWHYPQPHTFTPSSAVDVWGSPRQVGLYIHTPFCVEKCDYCPYAVRAKQNSEKIAEYVEALKQEIELCSRLPYMRGSQISSIYFGGGSPSILENEWLESLNNLIRSRFEIRSDAEFTVEVNPVDVDEEKLDALDYIGVNRISVGVQSFDPQTLRSMRRAHSAEEAVAAFELIKHFRFKNTNLDLIYAYPNQTLEELATSIAKAVALKPARITCASLSVYPKTELYYKVQKGLVRLPSETLEMEMFEFLTRTLNASGYELSVVLAFNLPGFRFRQEEDLLRGSAELVGLGLSAFSVANGYFYSNTNSFADYYKHVRRGELPITQGRKLDRPTQMAMSIIHGLRFLEIDGTRFKHRFGVDMEQVYGGQLEKLIAGGLLVRSESVYRLTADGMICLGPIMREFYREEPLFDKTYQGEAMPKAS